MIPAVITDTSITFFAKGRPWNLSKDHPKFIDIKQLLTSGSDDAERAIQLTDVRIAVDAATAGQAVLTEEGLFLNGKEMPSVWRDKAVAAPDSMKVLLVYPGDRVRVEGDEDAPDGIYTVGEVDNNDADKRVYVESEEDYFGFVANTSIKEIVEEGPRLPVEETPPVETEECNAQIEDEDYDDDE